MARAVVAGIPHHVTQRGNRREDVLFDEADYRRYLSLLGEYAFARGFEVLAYCLMTNHLHLVVIPAEDGTLASVLKPVHLCYAQYVNRTHGLSGRLWQGRFFSCAMDDAHTLAAIRYVERNPVRARLVRRAENYTWSSAAAHVGLCTDPLLSDITRLKTSAGVENWSEWLRETEESTLLDGLRLNTRTGRPLGTDEFVSRVERKTGRTLRPQPGGRPRTRQPKDKRKHG
jgi:putative transposase